jgi:hypothetical protein
MLCTSCDFVQAITCTTQKYKLKLVQFWPVPVCPQSVSVTVFPISVSVLMFVLISVAVVVRVFPLTVSMSVTN